MNEQQFNAFLIRSKDLLRRIETYRLAYGERSEVQNKNAVKLKVVTLIAGIITAVSSIGTLTVELSTLLTGVSGGITGILAMADNLFRWEESSNDNWRRSKKLEDLQYELYQYCLEASLGSTVEQGSLLISRVNERFSQETTLMIDNRALYESRAETFIENHGINSVCYQPDQVDASFDDERISEEATGITEVVRG
ncbi:hypothetical protein [Cerasicoccus arenae]|uniref:Uncharacterized protein n=1 Tax=Cerasicoccus arenae TaxID=424488 RepID=A0A8J3DA96_9BACT|nr:hypothetical protein [Cerasicoccus arenae]MBK1859298.1 hypothetical protein [Cerasicoccus arenae]GHB94322.1 hypothetical protein GCM10007047_07510 [Cerasicoccus arenae]